jgi:hypothetical protein
MSHMCVLVGLSSGIELLAAVCVLAQFYDELDHRKYIYLVRLAPYSQ